MQCLSKAHSQLQPWRKISTREHCLSHQCSLHVSLGLLKITPVSKTVGEGVRGGVYQKCHRGIKPQVLEGVTQVWIRPLPMSQLIQRLHCSLSWGIKLLGPRLNLFVIHPQAEVFTAAHPLPSEDVLDLLREKNEKIYLHIYIYIYIIKDLHREHSRPIIFYKTFSLWWCTIKVSLIAKREAV